MKTRVHARMVHGWVYRWIDEGLFLNYFLPFLPFLPVLPVAPLHLWGFAAPHGHELFDAADVSHRFRPPACERNR